MSGLTVDSVVKLILDHIGGSKISPTVSGITIQGTPIVVQGAGGGIGGILSKLQGNLVGNFVNNLTKNLPNPNDLTGSINHITSSLINNPVMGLANQAGNFAYSIQNTINTAEHLPSIIQSQISAQIQTLTNQATSFTTHTNILSGLVTDPTQNLTNLVGVHQLTGLASSIPGLSTCITNPGAILDSSSISAMASYGISGVVHADGTLNPTAVLSQLGASSLVHGPTLMTQLVSSLDPTVPGGLSGMTTALINATTFDQQQTIANSMTNELQTYSESMRQYQDSDTVAQNGFQLAAQTTSAIASVLPNSTNTLSQTAFGLTASSTLKDFNNQIAPHIQSQNISINT